MTTQPSPRPCADCDSGAPDIPPHDCTKYDRPPTESIQRAVGYVAWTTGDNEAAARMIAAAPALVAALEAAEHEMGQYVEWHHKHDGGCSIEFEDAYEQVRAALEAARGTA